MNPTYRKLEYELFECFVSPSFLFNRRPEPFFVNNTNMAELGDNSEVKLDMRHFSLNGIHNNVGTLFVERINIESTYKKKSIRIKKRIKP
jgi:hypothetical protein